MNPYKASQSPFKKVASVAPIGVRKSRGRARRVAKLQLANRESHGATKIAKGFTQITGPNSDRIKRVVQTGMTATTGLSPFNGLSLHATSGGHVYFLLECGTDFTNSTEAVGNLNNLKIVLDIQDGSSGTRTSHTGFLSTLGTGTNKNWYVEFPTRTAAIAASDIITIRIEFTT